MLDHFFHVLCSYLALRRYAEAVSALSRSKDHSAAIAAVKVAQFVGGVPISVSWMKTCIDSSLQIYSINDAFSLCTKVDELKVIVIC